MDGAHQSGNAPENRLGQVSGQPGESEDGTAFTIPEDITCAVDDAVLLLIYLTSTGEVPRPETVSGILTARKAIVDKAWSIQIGTAFLEAFADVSKQAKPITARSLVESEGRNPRRAIRLWSVLVWILLPILVFLSAISFMNGHFCDNAQKLIVLSYTAEKPGYLPPVPSRSANGQNPGSDFTVRIQAPESASPKEIVPTSDDTNAHNDALREILLEMQQNTYMLVKLSLTENTLDLLLKNSAFGDFLDSKDLLTQLRLWRAIAVAVISLNEIIFGVINTYILPLLCALLGAAAYGLRSLSEQTLTRTYRTTYTVYARAVLAVIIGFAVGFFSKFASSLSIEPLAAAFLAGYAVESFFIFLDTMLQAVRKPKS